MGRVIPPPWVQIPPSPLFWVMELYEIYIEVFSTEVIPLSEFLLDVKKGKYGNFSEEDIRAFRYRLENNIQESAYLKGEELSLSDIDIESVIEENIEEIRKTFLEVFGWL